MQICTNSAIRSLIRRLKMTFDTVHIVRPYGAGRFLSTDQLNSHRKKRVFYGLPQYCTVWCGAVRCGEVRFLFFTVRCDAVRLLLF